MLKCNQCCSLDCWVMKDNFVGDSDVKSVISVEAYVANSLKVGFVRDLTVKNIISVEV